MLFEKCQNIAMNIHNPFCKHFRVSQIKSEIEKEGERSADCAARFDGTETRNRRTVRFRIETKAQNAAEKIQFGRRLGG